MSPFKQPFWRKRDAATDTLTIDDRSEAPTPEPASPQAATIAQPPAPRLRRRDRRDDGRPVLTAEEVYFSTKEAARYMHGIYSHRSLERMRCEGGNKGPKFIKMPGKKRGRILYSKTEIDRWLRSLQVFGSTSEYDAD